MPHSTRTARAVILRIAASAGLLALVLAGAIVSVSMLSNRDAITLPGGIGVFASSITVWAVATAAIWARWFRRRTRGGGG